MLGTSTMTTSHPLPKRRLYLAIGTFTMLFAGVLYAWSILKIPFKEQFAWSDSALSFNFTLTMCFFCLGSFAGSLLCKRVGSRITLILSGVLVGAGFLLTALLRQNMLFGLYISYALMAGTGIGIAYNTIVSTVISWFPDRKGFCAGCLMMGFGIGTLLWGNVINLLFEIPTIGWNKAYLLFGILLASTLILSGLILHLPSADIVFPVGKNRKSTVSEEFKSQDFTTAAMLRSFTFWRAFFCLIFIAAAGTAVISFARDLSLSVGATPHWATTLVGILSLCNGLGRILTGAVYDSFGRRITMISANLLTVTATGITLLAVHLSSLFLGVIGLCLIGLSYGTTPTLSSAFVSSFYGQKHFAVNYSVMNLSIIITSFISAFSSTLYASTGSYTAPFVLLLSLAICALGLNVSIRKP